MTPALRERVVLRWWPWVLRVVWATLPFTVGPLLGAGLAVHSRPVQLVGAALAWLAWAVGLLATVVGHPIGLTALRMMTPALLGSALWGARVGGIVAWRWGLGIAGAAVACVVVLSAETGGWAVAGPAYPNEARFALRPPATLMGIVPVVGVVCAAAVLTGPLLLAARSWVAGAVLSVVGFAIAAAGARSLHQLSRRFVVFVPAGFVLHDHLAISEPVLFKRSVVESISLAAADTDSLDLSAKAPGLAVEVRLHDKVEIARVAADQRTADVGSTARFLVVPSRPGRVLAEARRRRYGV